MTDQAPATTARRSRWSRSYCRAAASTTRMEVPRNAVLVGDALDRLCRLPSASVDCVITSPPYFLLRNYGHGGQVGLEADVHAYVARIVAVCDELARVLKPAGTLWLNLGDSYSRHRNFGAPPKGMLLAPERILLALSERGWVVRNKVVWAKTNTVPASVTDRLRCTWEPLYVLTRSQRYFFDLDAIRQPHRSRVTPRPATNAAKYGEGGYRGPLAGTNSGLAKAKVEARVRGEKP